MGSVIMGSAIMGNAIMGSAIIGCSGVGVPSLAGRLWQRQRHHTGGYDSGLAVVWLSSFREASQLDNEVFLLSNCKILLHLGTTDDLLLALADSFIVFSVSAGVQR
jgi:hypothetical protein